VADHPLALYEGRLRHRRMAPREHSFEHRLFMAWIDLDRADELLGRMRLTSARRWAPLAFRREDYFGDPKKTLGVEVRDVVEERTGRRPEGPVRLLTHLRTWGVSFNPVSFYYCYAPEPDASGSRAVEAIVAEIRNTPWDERFLYVLGESAVQERRGRVATYGFRKDFHVSPFMPMDIDYIWKLTHPESPGDSGRRVFVHMENYREGQRVFDATLTLERRRTASDRDVLSVLLRYPMMPIRVLIWIYGHAAVLWLKKTPFYAHPETLPEPAEPAASSAATPDRPAGLPTTRPL
ncbi:MAG: DUF1365 domain-containing protein, partial [Acidobacteriota bacterium]